MKVKFIFLILFAFNNMLGFSQNFTVEFTGNLNPSVNSTVTYTAIFRNSNGIIITNPVGYGGFTLIAGNLGTVVSSNKYSATIQWTLMGSGTIEYGFVNESGNSVFEELYINVSGGSTPPIPIVNSASDETTSSFVANWNASIGATSYTLEVSLNNFTSIYRVYSGLTTLNKVVTSLTPGTRYYYRVRAFINTNASPNSSVINARTIPNPPTGLSTSSITQNSFVASWSPSNNAYQYKLDVSTNNFSTFVPGYNGKSLEGTSVIVTGLSGNTSYNWRVRVVNIGDTKESANSVIKSLSTLPPTLPLPIINSITNVTSNTFQVNWSSVSNATGYMIDVSENSTFSNLVSPYINLNVTGTSYFIQNLNPNTVYYVRVRAFNSAQSSQYSNSSKLTVSSVPQAIAASNTTSQSFTANWDPVAGATSYQIDIATNSLFNPSLYSINNITNNSYTLSNLTIKTNYYYRVRSVNPSGISENSNTVLAVNLDHNYIRSIDLLVPGKKVISAIYNLSLNEQTTQHQFFDGLGRPLQSVLLQESPLQKDIILPMAYDKFGREAKIFLPYVDPTEKNGWFKENALRDIASVGSEQAQYQTGKQYAFYQTQTNVTHDSKPFKQTVFESSPLNRPSEQGSSGSAWNPESGRTVKFQYSINLENEVLLWNLSSANLPYTSNYYEIGVLFKKLKTDEENHQVLEFVNKERQIVVKRVQVNEAANEWADTYYIYDEYGNLIYVLPPEAIKEIGTPTFPHTVSEPLLNIWAFQYKYDDRNRMIEKKVPGAEPVYMVYDDRDRLVLTQDGNQRFNNNKWSFTKYDALNRPVMTGEKEINNTRAGLADLLSGSDWLQNYAAYETLNGTILGYTSNSLPKTLNLSEVYSVTYYDNYDFKNQPEFGSNFDYIKPTTAGSCETVPQGTYCFENNEFDRVKGQVTGGQTRILDTDDWIKTTTYYDDRYRAIQNITQNTYHGVIERVSNLYNFPGWLLKTYKEQVSDGSNLGISNRFTYDHAGRLMAGYHEIFQNNVGNGEVLLAENKYNEIGELIEKNLHVENGIPQQSIDYRFNIRGWLESINNTSLLPDFNNVDETSHPKDLFGMELIYNQILDLDTP